VKYDVKKKNKGIPRIPMPIPIPRRLTKHTHRSSGNDKAVMPPAIFPVAVLEPD
jgi:hypothetical protein